MLVGKREDVVQEKGVNEYGDGVAWFRGSMIGKGGFGCVYLATLKNPRSKYSYFPSVMAVKSAEVSVSGSIQKEREVLSNVEGCPNIIRCFGEETTIGDGGVMVYNLLLEYGSGGTLADRIKKSSSNGLPEFEAKVYARRGGITEFSAKIGDFGLAKRAILSKKRKLEPYWRGTPMYLSPEAVIDSVQEAPCDIWALGCTVLEMLTGKPPWDQKNELNAEEILSNIGAGHGLPIIPNEISKEARDFLKGCFVRKSMYRLTAEMLLNHPFVEGLDDDEAIEEFEEVEDLNEVESMLLVSESDYKLNPGLFPDEWGFSSEGDSFSYWSEEDEGYSEDEVVSDFVAGEFEVEEIKGAVRSSTDAGLNQSTETSRQILSEVSSEKGRQYPISFTISTGV